MKKIGEFYKEKILILPVRNLKIVELPAKNGEVFVQKDLFGWKLISGKSIVECSSEEEARYLRVFLDIGIKDIKIPVDLNYLASILQELETLKSKTDEIIEMYLDSVLDKNVKEKVRNEVYMEIVK
ncbi:TPA: hypothetical protein DCW38_06760 [candidate division WOR-3 bacterium]|uniref:Uncharacterized protein n=1 Tax=candidate division WOR-3 bacterium TaxID=2052148 RepID=A0A350HBE8_UNCW3|nr:hypothetical protein [candidate division WOR-3 bacterium]